MGNLRITSWFYGFSNFFIHARHVLSRSNYLWLGHRAAYGPGQIQSAPFIADTVGTSELVSSLARHLKSLFKSNEWIVTSSRERVGIIQIAILVDVPHTRNANSTQLIAVLSFLFLSLCKVYIIEQLDHDVIFYVSQPASNYGDQNLSVMFSSSN